MLSELCHVNVNIFFIDKPENVHLATNASANKACQNDILKLTCSVGDANPEVTSYQLFRNGTDVGESNTRMWVKTLSNSGLLTYKCVANNSVGSSESPSVSVTVNGNHEFRFSCPPLLTLTAEPFFYFASLRQRSRVVSASDAQSGRSGFESRSGDFGFVLGRPEFKSSVTFVNSPVGAFNPVMSYLNYFWFLSI